MALPASAPTWLDLYDYRRRVAALWQEREHALRAGQYPPVVWQRFCAQKDALYAGHPQSPLPAARRAGFGGLRYFPYDAAFCVEADLTPEPAARDRDPVPAPAHAVPLCPAARLSFVLGGQPRVLTVYWVDVYGGGLFVPFHDATSGAETYGGGRYLFDTVKGSDFLMLSGGPAAPAAFGYGGGRVLLDFNYAYNPSCAYDVRWTCPLAPPDNRLGVPIRAGEQCFLVEGSKITDGSDGTI
jgi:uncharacterized protein (DUF1684 family)